MEQHFAGDDLARARNRTLLRQDKCTGTRLAETDRAAHFAFDRDGLPLRHVDCRRLAGAEVPHAVSAARPILVDDQRRTVGDDDIRRLSHRGIGGNGVFVNKLHPCEAGLVSNASDDQIAAIAREIARQSKRVGDKRVLSRVIVYCFSLERTPSATTNHGSTVKSSPTCSVKMKLN